MTAIANKAQLTTGKLICLLVLITCCQNGVIVSGQFNMFSPIFTNLNRPTYFGQPAAPVAAPVAPMSNNFIYNRPMSAPVIFPSSPSFSPYVTPMRSPYAINTVNRYRVPVPESPVRQCRASGACRNLDHGTTLPVTWRPTTMTTPLPTTSLSTSPTPTTSIPTTTRTSRISTTRI